MELFRKRRDAEFYLAALRFGQSLWLEGKPAQALLQCNKAFLADLRGDESVLEEWPAPYAAKRWLMEESRGGPGFLGNPVRHYQHLASRMSGPRTEVRSWRAWACFHLAEQVLPEQPRDEEQIEKEGLAIPSVSDVKSQLLKRGWAGEVETWLSSYF